MDLTFTVFLAVAGGSGTLTNLCLRRKFPDKIELTKTYSSLALACHLQLFLRLTCVPLQKVLLCPRDRPALVEKVVHTDTQPS